MAFVWFDPGSPHNQFRTMLVSDPATPPGWTLSGGSDGAQDMPVQDFVPGTCSGGFPRYPANSGNDILTDLRNLNGTGATGV